MSSGRDGVGYVILKTFTHKYQVSPKVVSFDQQLETYGRPDVRHDVQIGRIPF